MASLSKRTIQWSPRRADYSTDQTAAAAAEYARAVRAVRTSVSGVQARQNLRGRHLPGRSWKAGHTAPRLQGTGRRTRHRARGPAARSTVLKKASYEEDLLQISVPHYNGLPYLPFRSIRLNINDNGIAGLRQLSQFFQALLTFETASRRRRGGYGRQIGPPACATTFLPQLNTAGSRSEALAEPLPDRRPAKDSYFLSWPCW